MCVCVLRRSIYSEWNVSTTAAACGGGATVFNSQRSSDVYNMMSEEGCEFRYVLFSETCIYTHTHTAEKIYFSRKSSFSFTAYIFNKLYRRPS